MGARYCSSGGTQRDTCAPSFQRTAEALQALILERPVKSLEMGVVVRLPDPGMAMNQPSLIEAFGEPLGELTPVV